MVKHQEISLHLTEIFSSIQGESSLTGYPTSFVRLSGCNLRCIYCDTTYSFPRGDRFTLPQIIEKLRVFGNLYVCITGGEPLLQKGVYPLMRSLADDGFNVSLETGGSLSIALVDPRVKIILDVKCPKSGMHNHNHLSNLEQLRPKDEVKFVLVDREDYLFAKKIYQEYSLAKKGVCTLFSPAYESLCPKQLVAWILEDRLPIRLNLQIHKYIWGSHVPGV